ncbi:Erv1 / Alr family protein [Hirsutella rhossiliensis]|uniref:Sulfhydryl oxidase n=1 Tax=Hirsutella rhossiliensis TaxID=111463 RepID=A0A9P8MWD0_9HYPO|nr:erv1 / alr family domain-containing protein [Hirsutella rhossiliensis]KAH0963473.1 erv1 / alr family domain-containing protein [Hirsutella rhossiliensis]
MARRQHLTLTLLVVIALFFSISYLYGGPGSVSAHDAARLLRSVRDNAQSPLSKVPTSFKPASHVEAKPGPASELSDAPGSLLDGESIAPKLENATLKAELGRATWKFLHTMAAKYPEKPTPEDRKTFELFFLSFGKLYPCGDCAKHFRALLKEMPPQTSSRNSAAGWLCEAHNRVNKRLQKPIFDCNNIGDFYDCGCGDDKGKDKKGKDTGKKGKDTDTKDKATADKKEGRDAEPADSSKTASKGK